MLSIETYTKSIVYSLDGNMLLFIYFLLNANPAFMAILPHVLNAFQNPSTQVFTYRFSTNTNAVQSA